MNIVLRFRDLNIPEGATIERHKEIIEREGIVMWGWMMRRSEEVPLGLLRNLATAPSEVNLFLFDSGSAELRRSTLSNLSAFPGGIEIPTPHPASTPQYMAEAHCPAWFHLSDIDNNILTVDSVTIKEFPTLPNAKPTDTEKLMKPIALEDLRDTGATLWVIANNYG